MKRLGAFFDRIAEHFREIRINIQDVFGFLIGKTGIGFQPGPKAERKAILTRVFAFVGIIVFITILLIIGIPWIKYYNTLIGSENIGEKEWLAYIGSFWGALTASVLTLVGTIVSTWLIIRRSYKVDYHRERLEYMPVLQLHIDDKATREINTAENKEEAMESYPYMDDVDCEEDDLVVIKIQNIGKGIAFEPSTENSCETMGDIVFPPLCPGQTVDFLTFTGDVPNRIFVFHFFDMFENYYSQEVGFEFPGSEGKVYPVVKPPELIIKTKKIRYVQ